jgi:molecular chaperone GrpE
MRHWQCGLESLDSRAAVTHSQDDVRDEGPKEGDAQADAGHPGDEASASAAPVDPLEAAQAEASRVREQLLRLAADFDNFRKRSRREQADGERRAREDQLRELLPVFDNLERATAHAESATEVRALSEGIQMVIRQFQDTLAKLGVERVPGVGHPFDPAVHEAVQHVETSEVQAGHVAAEAQAGYKLEERLIRPALVVVAKPKSDA